MNKLKGYGKHRLVCYKHRSIIGASRISFGNCKNCGKQVNAAVGSLPNLCDECSISLSECAICRIPLK